jgi:hypothetical protein
VDWEVEHDNIVVPFSTHDPPRRISPMILETAVGSTHLAQPIDSPGISGENLITNKVTAISPDTPDKSIDYTCTHFQLPFLG